MKVLEFEGIEPLVVIQHGDLESKEMWLNLLDKGSIRCTVHPTPEYHRPHPLRLVLHHVQPLGMGGADSPGNWIITCDTGHFNMHRLMGDLLRTGQMRIYGTDEERHLAYRGYTEWISAGRPGKPVFEFV